MYIVNMYQFRTLKLGGGRAWVHYLLVWFHMLTILCLHDCMCISVLGKSQFTVNGLVFGLSIGAMGLLILITMVVLTAMLIRSRKQASKLTTTEHPMSGEPSSEITITQPEQSSTAIDMERNVAYISLADARQSVQVPHT